MKSRATRMRMGGGRVLPIATAVAAIFASAAVQGSQMFRYEAGDMSSMYQDNIGSAQVIAYEQPVGMWLDTSQQQISDVNRAPRLEAAAFPTVSGSPDWHFNGTYVEAVTAFVGGNAAPGVFVAGRIYRCEFEIYDYVSGTVALPYDGLGANNKQVSRSGKFSHMIRPLQSGMFLYSFNFIGKIRNFKVQEIPFTELVTNSGFNTNLSGWTPVVTAGGTVTWSTGTAAIDSGPTIGDTARLRQTVPAIAGMWYEINCYITNWVGASANNLLQIGSTVGGTDLWSASIAANGNVRGIFRSTGTSINLQFYCTNEAGVRKTYNLDNVSLRELPGNHLTQATSTARPVLSARTNLVTYSEQFDNAAWQKQTSGTATAPAVTANSHEAPDGTMTADSATFMLNGGTTSSDFSQISSAAIPIFTGAIYNGAVWLRTTDGTTKVMSLVNPGGNPTAIVVTPEWQRFTSVGASLATGSGALRIRLRGNESTADSASICMWAGQAGIGSTVDRYQRIYAATDYDPGGFPAYLRFDGVDDCLFTPGTVDFSGTDKVTVVAGMQKNTDTAAGIVVELGPNLLANDGSFYLVAPASATPSFQAAMRGTATTSTSTSNIYPAPYKGVLTGLLSITQFPTVRVDGRAFTSASNGGTGNYGNYQMYVGRRNNVSNQANIQLYTLMGTGRIEGPDSVLKLETYAKGAQT